MTANKKGFELIHVSPSICNPITYLHPQGHSHGAIGSDLRRTCLHRGQRLIHTRDIRPPQDILRYTRIIVKKHCGCNCDIKNLNGNNIQKQFGHSGDFTPI